jgi:cytochrome bd ubiquinol oxidase subunit II
MQLSDAWMLFVILALTMYVVLDGYDLGIGTLTLFEPDGQRRRDMHALVAWTWDGNESWIVLIGLTLWAGLPLVTGIALPALAVPIFVMLFSLIARGVAIEMIDQHKGWHRGWGKVFGIGSLTAGFAQGAAFGGLVAGFDIQGDRYAGGPFTFLHHGYAVLTGLTAVALYVLAGCAWLYHRTDGETQLYAARTGRGAAVAVAAGTAASWLLAAPAGPLTLHPGDPARLPFWIIGVAVVLGGLVLALRSFSSDARTSGSDRSPVYAALLFYGGGLLIAGGLLYPTLVPPDVTVHAAASPHSSLVFLMIAFGIFIPIILTYQAYGYWVFRGKVTAVPGHGADAQEVAE